MVYLQYILIKIEVEVQVRLLFQLKVLLAFVGNLDAIVLHLVVLWFQLFWWPLFQSCIAAVYFHIIVLAFVQGISICSDYLIGYAVFLTHELISGRIVGGGAVTQAKGYMIELILNLVFRHF